jgi:catechol 2,3-dioxygenase-like lactoylglutathione lyase family enzyme
MTEARLSPHYHVGIVVKDVAEAQAVLAEQLGVTWGPVLHIDALDLRDGAGADLVLPNTFCYSVEAPHIELLEEVPGSVWVCNEHSNLHHIGFWADDLPSETARLTDIGCPLQLCGRNGSKAPATFSYLGNPLGIRIEIVDSALLPMMDAHVFAPPSA